MKGSFPVFSGEVGKAFLLLVPEIIRFYEGCSQQKSFRTHSHAPVRTIWGKTTSAEKLNRILFFTLCFFL